MFHLKARSPMNQLSNQPTCSPKPTRELLLALYERKDAKRRRFLYHHYRHLFEKPYSISYLVEVINQDLGEALVTYHDIKYIRANIYKWKKEVDILPVIKSQAD